jgi:hypothetical protein
MALCLTSSAVFLPSVQGGGGDISATVYVLAAVQPADLNTCTNVLLTGSEAANFTQAIAPFDPALAASFWMFSLTFAVGIYLISKNIGVIISAVRRW